MSEKRLVIFDLDNTLVINRPATKKAYASAIRYIAKESKLEFDKLYHHWKRMVQALEKESSPEKRSFVYSLTQLLAQHKLADIYISPAMRIFEKELTAEIKPLPGAKEILSWLKEQGCHVAVAAGIERGLAKKKLKTTGLLTFIDDIVSASDIGIMKPHPDYFNQLLSNFDIKPTQTVVISDSKTEDLDPAAKLGIRTIMIATTNPQLTALKPELSEFLSFAA